MDEVARENLSRANDYAKSEVMLEDLLEQEDLELEDLMGGGNDVGICRCCRKSGDPVEPDQEHGLCAHCGAQAVIAGQQLMLEVL